MIRMKNAFTRATIVSFLLCATHSGNFSGFLFHFKLLQKVPPAMANSGAGAVEIVRRRQTDMANQTFTFASGTALFHKFGDS
jgi:hypothetical protein